jgi:hypothetical protein
MSDQDVSEIGMVSEDVVERQDHTTWVSPDRVAPLPENRFTQRVSADART